MCSCCGQNRAVYLCPFCGRGFCEICADEGAWDPRRRICEDCATREVSA